MKNRVFLLSCLLLITTGAYSEEKTQETKPEPVIQSSESQQSQSTDNKTLPPASAVDNTNKPSSMAEYCREHTC